MRRFSLRLTNARSATPFGATVRKTALDAAKYPIIGFDYRIPDRLRLDFRLSSDDKNYIIKFTDRDVFKDLTSLGQIPDLVADEKWHHAEIPLLEWLQKAAPDAKSRVVTNFVIQDGGWLGNSRGVQWWVDNFHPVPRFSGPNLKATVELRDITGVKGVSWLLDARPDSVPDERAESQKSIEATGTGRLWLHVRAQSGAGKWSETGHWPVWLGS